MRKQLLRVTFLFLIGAGVISSFFFDINIAYAFGIGGYLSYGSGSVDFEESWDTEDPWARLENKGDVTHLGLGFILDTAVAKNKIFNYRLQIGYERAEYDINSVINQETGIDLSSAIIEFKVDMDQIVFDNTFGFGIVRNEKFRLWVGPQIRVGYMTGNGNVTDIFGTTLALDFEGVVYGFAPVVGANINFRNNLTIGLDLGYRFSGFAGVIDKTGLGQTGGDDFYGNTDSIFINFAVIYRLNDNYE